MTKHTPGPWRVDGRFINAAAREDPRIAYTYSDFAGCSHPEADANARLIAAAPELLAFVRAQYESTCCICRLNSICGTDVTCAQCEAAALLAKAEGQ